MLQTLVNGQATSLDYTSTVKVKQFLITDDNRLITLSINGNLYYNQFRKINYYKTSNNFIDLFSAKGKNYVTTNEKVYEIKTNKNTLSIIEIEPQPLFNNRITLDFLGDRYFKKDSLLISAIDTIDLPQGVNDIYIDHDEIYISCKDGIKLYDQVNWKSLKIPGHSLKGVEQIANNDSIIAFSKSLNLTLFYKSTYDIKTLKLSHTIDDIILDSLSNVWLLSNEKIYYLKSKQLQTGSIKIDKVFINNKIRTAGQKVEMSVKDAVVKLVFDIRESLPEDNEFFYMVDGLHEKWQLLNSNEAVFELPYGEFKVLTKSSINKQDNIATALTFINSKPDDRKILYWIVATLGTLLLLVMYLYYRNESQLRRLSSKVKYLQTKSALTKSQLKALQLQLNPHFLFNALNSIQGLIVIGESNKAKSQLRNFSLLMREVLDYSDKESISILDDVEFLKKYLSLEQLNHDHRFDFKFTVDINLPDNISIPPMITQIPIENAILHGFKNIKGGGLIDIHYQKSGRELIISIKDNGVGLQKKKMDHISKGSNIIKKRLKSKDAFTISNIMRNEEIVGCLAEIRIPI